jgi:hypothetical protein
MAVDVREAKVNDLIAHIDKRSPHRVAGDNDISRKIQRVPELPLLTSGYGLKRGSDIENTVVDVAHVRPLVRSPAVLAELNFDD